MTDYGWMKISSGDGSWPSTPYPPRHTAPSNLQGYP